MHHGYFRRGVHLSLGLHGECLSPRTKFTTADTTPSWDVPAWRGWESHRTSTGAWAGVRFPHSPRSHWPGGLHVLREKWVTEHSTRLSLGRTLRLAPNHTLPAFPPLLHKSLLRHQFCQHPDAGQQASRTRQSERCSLASQSYGAEQAGAGFHTQIPSCGRDTIQPTGCLPRAPPLYSPMIHSGHFLMTSFLVTNSFSSHI